jgi:hypothetical protein
LPDKRAHGRKRGSVHTGEIMPIPRPEELEKMVRDYVDNRLGKDRERQEELRPWATHPKIMPVFEVALQREILAATQVAVKNTWAEIVKTGIVKVSVPLEPIASKIYNDRGTDQKTKAKFKPNDFALALALVAEENGYMLSPGRLTVLDIEFDVTDLFGLSDPEDGAGGGLSDPDSLGIGMDKEETKPT